MVGVRRCGAEFSVESHYQRKEQDVLTEAIKGWAVTSGAELAGNSGGKPSIHRS
jgi:hypothetical protein